MTHQIYINVRLWRTKLSLLCVLALSVLPTRAADPPPVVSIVYVPAGRQYDAMFQSTRHHFVGTPLEIRKGVERKAVDSSRAIIVIKECRYVGEQQYGQFIREQLLNDMRISATEFVGRWKNIAVQIKYDLVLRNGTAKGRKRTKRSGTVIGIARGKTGRPGDVKLDNNADSLIHQAYDRAAVQWHSDLLENVIMSPVIAPQIWQTLSLQLAETDETADGDGSDPMMPPLIFQAASFTVVGQEVQAEFRMENGLPFRTEFAVEYYIVYGKQSLSIRSVQVKDTKRSAFSLASGQTEKRLISAPAGDTIGDGPIQGVIMRIKGSPKYSR